MPTTNVRAIPIDRDGHHALSPSGAHRWINCLASPWLEAEVRELAEAMPASAAALEGTAAHEESEQVLLGKKPECVDYPEAQEYVDYVHEILTDPLIEVSLSYEEYIPGGKGTADAMGVEGGVLHVIDLKFGKGIKVFANDNLQGKLYLLGALATVGWVYDFDIMSFHICQPRLGHLDAVEYTVKEILEFGEQVKAILHLMLTSKKLPTSPGEDQCRWCAAGAMCSARADWAMKIACAEFGVIDND